MTEFADSVNHGVIADLNDDEDLFESGIVNSLFAIQLMTFIEKSFALEVGTFGPSACHATNRSSRCAPHPAASTRAPPAALWNRAKYPLPALVLPPHVP